jgi:DNA anti-recombination protein RmuC
MNANGPRISGLEPPEAATDTQGPAELAAATVEAELPTTEAPRSSKRCLRTIGFIAAILVAAGASLYTCILQQQVQALRTQLVRTQAAAQAALGEVNRLKIPKDLSADLASLEATVNKLKAASEARQKTFEEETKKIPALDSRLTAQVNALASKQTQTEQELKSFREKNEGRMDTLIAVLKNQDKILRQLVEGKAEPGRTSREP